MAEIDTNKETEEPDSDSDEVDPNRTSYGKCMICLENLYKDEHRMFLPCSHQYHDACIRPWLKTQTVCPNCKVSIYVHVDEKDPEKIPEEYMNPADSRTMSEVMRERQEQQDILDQIQGGGGFGGSRLFQGVMRGMGGNQADQLLSGLLADMLDARMVHGEQAPIAPQIGVGGNQNEQDPMPPMPPMVFQIPTSGSGMGVLMNLLDAMDHIHNNQHNYDADYENEGEDDDVPPLEGEDA